MRRPYCGALALLMLCGCGLPNDADASRIAADSVPFGLLESASSPAEVVATPLAGDRSAAIYLIRDGGLVRVDRRGPEAPSAAQVLQSLVRGATPDEAQAGIGTTAFDQPPSVLVGPGQATVTVDLEPSFGEISSQNQVLAFAQIVYTLADLPSVDAVEFTLDGGPVDVLRSDGSLAPGAVTPTDYADLAPGAPPS